MKIAVLSESTADEAAVSILIEGLLKTNVEIVRFPEPPSRGWRGVLTAVELVLRHLHYRTDADALVVTLDSDESPVHRKEHEGAGNDDPKCRLCQLQRIITTVQSSLKPRRGCGPIRVAIGIAVPAIEAWCLCGTDAHITESAWIQALQSHRFPYAKRDLKQRLYGSPDPVLKLETERLVEQARNLLAREQLQMLENCFPIGFGSLAVEVRSWAS